MTTGWIVRIGREAERDFGEIARWTVRNFGDRQAEKYIETISLAIDALKDGPGIPGATARDDIEPGMRILHVARQGRRGRHFVVFRIGGDRIIDVLRLLHDSMDLPRHLP